MVAILKHLALTVLLLAASAGIAAAGDFSALGGTIFAEDLDANSYSWQLAYSDRFDQHFGWGVTYLNEGHLPERHRDGYAPLLYTHVDLLDGRMNLAAGAGPYLFFNTYQGTRNLHGLKGLGTVAATWYGKKNWFFQLRGNVVAGGEDVDTLSALAGVGYRFSPSAAPEVAELNPLRRNELTLLLGEAVLNSNTSKSWGAAALEYRRTLLSHLDATASFLVEGDGGNIRRDGFIVQLWGIQEIARKLSIGIGAGPYLRVTSYDTPPADDHAAAVISLTASYRLAPSWSLRATWNRFYTTSDSDADVIVGGVGYLF